MPNMKKYLLTGVILGTIAAFSAGLIALTNLITNNRIIKNEADKISSGIKEIFGDEAQIKNEQDLNNYQYAVHLFEINNEKDEFLGYALKSEGSNMYGKISLISGFDAKSHSFMSLYLVKNEQTYASTLVDNYIEPLNNEERTLEDVSCGATYGAKLVRDMINEALLVLDEFWK